MRFHSLGLPLGPHLALGSCRVSVASLVSLRFAVVFTVWYLALGVLPLLCRQSRLHRTITSSHWWLSVSALSAGMASMSCLSVESLRQQYYTPTYQTVELPSDMVIWTDHLLLGFLRLTGALLAYHALVCSIVGVPWSTMNRLNLQPMGDGFAMEDLESGATSGLVSSALYRLLKMVVLVAQIGLFLHGSPLAIAYLLQPPTMFVVALTPAPRLVWMPPSFMVTMNLTNHNIVRVVACRILLSRVLSWWVLHVAEGLLVQGVRCGFDFWRRQPLDPSPPVAFSCTTGSGMTFQHYAFTCC